jgi:HlyD family secretion protein
MNWLRSFTAVASVVSLLIAQSGCHRQTATPAASAADSTSAVERVSVGKPVRKTLTRSTTQPGRIEAFEQAPLYPKLAGYIQNVLVDIGDSVEKDQLLIKLSIPEMLDEVKQMEALVAQADAEITQADAAEKAAEAALDVARAKVAQAEAGVGRAAGEYDRWHAEHTRLTQLASGGSVTQKLVDETLNQVRASEAARQEATANVQSALASLRAAQANVHKSEADAIAAGARRQVAAANLARAKTLLAYTEIKAPFTGVVTVRNVNIGHFVQPVTGRASDPLLVVEQTDKVRVFVDVPEMESQFVDSGSKPDSATVRVQSLADKEIPGTVTRTSRSLETRNRSLRVEIDLPNADGVLRPGMYANVDILLGKRDNVLSLPATAIVREGGATYCCLVESGKINRKKIELGLRAGADVEVRSGLDANQLVVLARADSLKQGQPVEIIAPAQ